MPAPSRLHKPIPTPADTRLEMCRLMAEELFAHSAIPVKASDFEITNAKETTTYQTKIKLEQQFPDDQFLFVFGTDVLPFISNWPDGSKFLVTSQLIILERSGSKYKSMPKNILFLNDYAKKDISSSGVRSLLHQALDVSDKLPKSVFEYIHAQGLYK